MNTHTPRAQQHRQVQSLAVLAMFTAILFLLTFTPHRHDRPAHH